MAREDIRGGLWTEDIEGQLARDRDVYNKYLKSAEGSRKAQFDAIKANLRRRGLSDSGVATGAYSNFAEGLQRADLGMAVDLLGQERQVRENATSRLYDEHSQARAWNEQGNQARKQKNAGWGQLVGGIAGMAMGGNPYAALLKQPTQQDEDVAYYQRRGSQSNLLNSFAPGWADMASKFQKPRRPQVSGDMYYNRRTNQMR